MASNGNEIAHNRRAWQADLDVTSMLQATLVDMIDLHLVATGALNVVGRTSTCTFTWTSWSASAAMTTSPSGARL